MENKNKLDFTKEKLFNFNDKIGGCYFSVPFGAAYIFIPKNKAFIAIKIDNPNGCEDCKEKEIQKMVKNLVKTTGIRRVAIYDQNENDGDVENEGIAKKIYKGKNKYIEYEIKFFHTYFWQNGERPILEPNFDIDL